MRSPETKVHWLKNSGGPPAGGSEMEARVAKLEILSEKTFDRLAALERDVAVIKANGATKSDIADCKTAIAEAKSSVIIWVAGIVFLAQLVPSLIRLAEKYI